MKSWLKRVLKYQLSDMYRQIELFGIRFAFFSKRLAVNRMGEMRGELDNLREEKNCLSVLSAQKDEVIRTKSETIQEISSKVERIDTIQNDLVRMQNLTKDDLLIAQKEHFQSLYEQIYVIKDELSKVQNIANAQGDRIVSETRGKFSTLDRMLYRQIPRPILNFEVHLASHCNLNCKSCAHFSPLVKEEYTNINSYENDFRRISELTKGEVGEIYYTGGEPLLNPDIAEYMRISRTYFPNTNIYLITNGLILLEQEKMFWESCKKYDITLSPTKYPINVDYEQIKSKAQGYGVKQAYWSGGGYSKTNFTQCSLDCSGSQEAAYSFSQCWQANRCIFLQDGKLFTCVTIPNIKHFNKYFDKSLIVSDKDYIDIYEAKNINEILEFLSKPIPFCRYCAVSKWTSNNKWELSKCDISEWT
jgi:organic radical activating enzyme